MYLKAIEVQGFKSFANKIKFDFHNGITAIVGPNGSGKSNVADAVRWVLGEQSAKTLRGSSMQDIIFAGTGTKKAHSYAYVSIILDNSDRVLKPDFDEVVVTRRVFRSGESEYLINNNACRLRDIHQMFYDTGIGKEGYSIIGQGQIERILSERPEERRELFDEAAGIVQYKKNKEDAVKKIDQERQSLSRVKDIIDELELRIPNLENDSQKAKQFLSMRDKLRDKEIAFFNLSYNNNHENIDKIREQKQNAAQELLDCETLLSNIKKDHSNNQERLEALTHEISSLISISNDKQTQMNQYETHIELLKSQIQTIEEKRQDGNQRLEKNNQNIADKLSEIDNIENEKLTYTQKETVLSKAVNTNESELSKLKTEIEEAKNKQSNISEEIYKYTGEINSSDVYKGKNDEQISLLNQELEMFSKKIHDERAALDAQIKDCDTNKKKTDTESLALIKNEENRKKVEEEIRILDLSISEKIFEHTKINREIDNLNSKISIYQAMIDNYEGYSFAIKKIMEHKSNDDNIIGVVADIIKIQPKYETAIEIALGGRLQNIIVNNDATAKKMIDILKKNKYGRATFLPLSDIRSNNYKVADSILNEKGVIGYAYDLIESKKEYTDLLKYLLGSIIVVDNIDNAVSLSKKYNKSVRMVTLEGELFAVGGSITGGDYKKNQNLLGRKNDIISFEKELKEKTTLLAKIDKNKDELSAKLKSLKEELDRLNIENNNLKLKIQEYDLIDKQLKSRMFERENLIAEIESNIKLKKTRLESIENDISDNEISINNKKEKVKELKSEFEVWQGKLDALGQEALELADCLEKNKIEFSTLSHEIHFRDENIARLRKEVAELEADVRSINEINKNAVNDTDNKNKEIEDKKAQISRLKEEHSEKLEEISQKEQERNDISEKTKKLFSQLDEKSEEFNILTQEHNRLINILDNLENKINSLLDYMWNDYELSLDEMQAYPIPDDITENKLEKEIKDLKKSIKDFGDVNIGAVEEFENVSQRLEVLQKQKNDIEVSEGKLNELIMTLNKKMAEQFESNFVLIRKYFDEVFKELFGGGNTTLSLVDEDNILSSGVMINVQPPGKKLQNMMVLSGGEKSLTAIALLFAIQKLKPSPFCLLDEIEAALDDSNVDRFAGYLSNLTNKTQFIIITHRKGTMAAADRLYGITMQEKGVSSLVSVSLVEEVLD